MKKKKPDMLTILLYAIIVFAVLYDSAALGAAMDLSVNDKGTLDCPTPPRYINKYKEVERGYYYEINSILQ